MHRVTAAPDFEGRSVDEVLWKDIESVEEWLKSKPVEKWKKTFEQDGYLIVESLLNESELNIYRGIYDKLLSGEIDASNHRHDLGNHEDKKTSKENICQIMWPSVYIKNLNQGPAHLRANAVAKILLGDDMAFDFDMLISKAPFSNTPTPCHQDESYWLDMPDKRTVSCWVAMDRTTVDNGCMWFGVGSHKWDSLRKHRPVKPGVHVLTCDGSEEELTPAPLNPGDATLHSGRTMHYSRGNSTEHNRRGFITNFRPLAMVEFERSNNYDHGLQGVHKVIATGNTHQQHST